MTPSAVDDIQIVAVLWVFHSRTRTVKVPRPSTSRSCDAGETMPRGAFLARARMSLFAASKSNLHLLFPPFLESPITSQCPSTLQLTPSPYSVLMAAAGTSSGACTRRSASKPPPTAPRTLRWATRRSSAPFPARPKVEGTQPVGEAETRTRRCRWRLGLRGSAGWIGRGEGGATSELILDDCGCLKATHSATSSALASADGGEWWSVDERRKCR